ncbi:hypothetical protein FCL47_13345 [Desulfopila sp. IMCC35006]|uniref:PstS family phosphate ABC transporter substrate-binding protein n=1 Tax=Desulfopila sp. IMCC35006 TaxID=2569542 RepID=UPI0010AD350A|nr:substrate-binding domain-containing protein [Desulfopila sp. IMCC35006]TKB25521.1 hypothetical protein FCL47_13345 [Desulfopila sp. IMCC35006]
MTIINWINSVFMATVFMLSASQCWSQATGTEQTTLTAAGSGVNLGITRLLATAFTKVHPELTIDVPGSIGTRGAIQAVVDNAIHLGLISRPLKAEEEARGIVALPYARVAIVIGVNPMVKEQAISSSELIEIFKGNKTRWKDGNEIIVQAREKSDSGFLVLEKNIPGFREVYEDSHKNNRWTLFYTDQDANHALSATPYSIGVSDQGMISTEHLKIKALRLDGVEPGPETLLSGKYPLSRQLSFIYHKGNLTDAARKFVNFVFSIEGHKILESNGYLPLN